MIWWSLAAAAAAAVIEAMGREFWKVSVVGKKRERSLADEPR
jgi:hypothetical protein